MGAFHGQGKLSDLFNEIKINGEFKEGVPDGRAVIDYSDGCQYVGEVSKGFRHGKGRLTFGANSLEQSYRGEFSEDEMTGEGELCFKNGNVYRGTFLRGVLHGNCEIETK